LFRDSSIKAGNETPNDIHIYAKAISTLEQVQTQAAETLRQSQQDAMEVLEHYQRKAAYAMTQLHQRYFSFAFELQKESQKALDKFQDLISALANYPGTRVISQELQSTLDTIKLKYKAFKSFEDIEAKQLKALQEAKAAELIALQDLEARELKALQEADYKRLKDLQNDLVRELKTLQSNFVKELKKSNPSS